MDIGVIFRIAGLGILIAVFSIVLRQAGKDEQAQLLTLAGLVLVMMMVLQLISQLFRQIQLIFGF
ncbi:MAG: stage III sporulation protein AC [Firmicutes bacterium]|nr:stage III sporulation protein AC [Bacillota bacterium]